MDPAGRVSTDKPQLNDVSKKETYGIVLVLQTLNVHTMIREEVGVQVGDV
jgi:hypothetical protein